MLFAPRTWPWSRATPASGGASSTTCSWRASRAGPGCARTTTRSSSSAERCQVGRPGAAARGRRAARPAYVQGSDVAAERDSALHTLDVWDSQLAQVGSHLLYARLRLLRDLGPYLGKAYDEVSAGQSDARVAYKSSLREETAARLAAGEVPEVEELRAEVLASLAEVRAQEIERGVCLVGPHRDDMVLTLGELPAKGYASHGESWSFALGLKLAAFQLLRHDLGDDPVLVLDDVFAELDTGRRERLAAMIGDCEQVIITAAVPADVPAGLVGRTSRRDPGLGDPVSDDESASR